MRITAISDTHNRHKEITKDLPGGDLLLCTGDISSMGYIQEIKNFCSWFAVQDYEQKVFIAGNHDWGFKDYPALAAETVLEYDVEYLQDDLILYSENPDLDYSEATKIWGTPWQPEFMGWAFNLPKNGEELEAVWDKIPIDTDILLTHGPAWGHLDTVKGQTEHLGCELLTDRIDIIKPKIHIFGHIHTGYGHHFVNGTHFINASVLNESYRYVQKPLTFDWDKDTNELNFI